MKSETLSLILVLMMVSYSRADDSRLILHYAFDEGAGTRAGDSSGTGNDGAIHGAAFVKSPRGRALRFDGVDDFVECG